jgi:hypothetical protein
VLLTTVVVVTLNVAFFVIFVVQFNLPYTRRMFNGTGQKGVLAFEELIESNYWIDKCSLLLAGFAAQMLLFELLAVIVNKHSCLRVTFWVLIVLQILLFSLNFAYRFAEVILSGHFFLLLIPSLFLGSFESGFPSCILWLGIRSDCSLLAWCGNRRDVFDSGPSSVKVGKWFFRLVFVAPSHELLCV